MLLADEMNAMRIEVPDAPIGQETPAVDTTELHAMIRELRDENEFLKDREFNFVETVRLLKKQIEKERHESKLFKNDANAFRNKKSEMEDLFL